MQKKRQRNRKIDALVGVLLGLGAPLGWLAWRLFLTQKDFLLSWLKHELTQSAEIYLYMTAGTVVVFTLFGYFLGRRNDLIRETSETIKDSLEKMNLVAMTDALTGIPNARYLHDHLSLEMESAKRYDTPITCLMLDIDDFKKINDTYGHPSGDLVLTTLARTVLRCVRRVDMVGRLGGEEFLILMPHTSSEVALSIAERIRQAVQRWPFTVKESQIPVTVSIGAASYPAPGITNKSSLLAAADDALYEAKRAGKNQTIFARTTSFSSKESN